MLNLIAVEIDHREAEVVVAPNKFAIFDSKRSKANRIQISPDIRMKGMTQEWLKVHFLFGAVIKTQPKTVSFCLRCRDHVNPGDSHLSLLVIRSGLIDLCRTKKSIHFDTISFAFADMIS